MKSAGIDVASSGWTAIGLVVDGVPQRAVVWKPDDKRDSLAVRLDQQYAWLRMHLKIFKPDVVSVEELAVFMNKTTIRTLARHEGVALLAAKRSGSIVLNPSVGQSRRIVFGNGNLSKDDSWIQFKKLYPHFVLLAKNSGGTDQMDALVHALAAPTLLEQR